jgi:hypothetical protein
MGAAAFTNAIIPSIPAGAVTNVDIDGTAEGEIDLGVTGGGWAIRIYAITVTAYVVFGLEGAVPTPTTDTGWPIAPGTYQDFQVRSGWHMDVIGSGAGKIRYFL